MTTAGRCGPQQGGRQGLELRAVVERDVEAVHCETALVEAVALLRARGHRPLPVCAGGRVVGLLDGRALAERLAGGDLDVRTARVHDLHLPDLICGWEDEDVTDALALMRARNLSALLVLDREGGVVGWVTVEARSGHGG